MPVAVKVTDRLGSVATDARTVFVPGVGPSSYPAKVSPNGHDFKQRCKAATRSIRKSVAAEWRPSIWATDLKHERAVAIKVMLPEIASALGAERFLREIRVAADLSHPHILPLHDSGETEDGLLYYVMPFVDGESLRERLQREGRLPSCSDTRASGRLD